MVTIVGNIGLKAKTSKVVFYNAVLSLRINYMNGAFKTSKHELCALPMDAFCLLCHALCACSSAG